jgi:hypothetical protein
VIAIKDACKEALSQLEENLIGHHPESLDEKNMPSGKKDIHGSSQQADPTTRLKMEKEKVGDEQVRHFLDIKTQEYTIIVSFTYYWFGNKYPSNWSYGNC